MRPRTILLLLLSLGYFQVGSMAWAQNPAPTLVPREEWLKSAAVEDLNKDGLLDEEDYEIYKEIAAEDQGDDVPGGQQPGQPQGPLPNQPGQPGGNLPGANVGGLPGNTGIGNLPGGNIGNLPGGNVGGLPGIPPIFTSPDEWRKSAEAEDLNRDGQIDREDFEIYREIAAEAGGGIPGGQQPNQPGGNIPGTPGNPGGGNLPGSLPGSIPSFASLDEWRKSAEAEDLNRDGQIDDEDFEIYKEIAAEGAGIPGGQQPGQPNQPGANNPGNNGNLPGGEVLAAFNDWVKGPQAADLNGDFRIDRQDYERFVRDPQAALPAGFEIPLGGERFEGNLDGVDFEKELLIISRRELHPADAVILQDREGNLLDPYQLREVVGSHPRVEVTLNGDEEIVRMVILNRIELGDLKPQQGGEDGQPQGSPVGQEYFGAVGRIDAGRIVLSGPRFRVTASTRAADEENKPIELTKLPIGELVAVTPGPPDPSSGSPEPTANRIQVVDPRRPPQARYDLVSGDLIALAGGVLELAGPVAALGPATRFTSSATNQALQASDIKVGDFVRISTSPPGFGDTYAVATEVVVLPAAVGGGAPPAQQPGQESSGSGNSGQEIRVDGYIADVDEEGRYVSLEGERFELDSRALILGLDDERVQLDYLVEGDLLEIDTRPGGKKGSVVTRIKVVDPAVQTFQRPGVKTGSFAGVEEGELVLTGPFFEVPDDANIQGQGGKAIELGELEEGDYVRLAASAPRYDRGETLPVAYKIRLSQAPQAATGNNQPNLPGQEDWLRSPEAQDMDGNGRIDPADYEMFLRRLNEQQGGQQPGPIQGNGRRVVGSFPEDGDVEIPAAGVVEVTFNQPVNDLLFQPEFQFMVFPQPLAFGSLEISADGRSISAVVDLEEDQVYQLVVISRDTGLYSVRFSTGSEISTAAVAGEIHLPGELPGNAGFVPGQSYAALLAGVDQSFVLDGESESLQEHIAAGAPLQGPRFSFKNVNPGTYRLAAFITLNLGPGGMLDLQVLHPEPVVVSAGQEVKVDLQVALPEPLQVVSLTPQSGAVGVAREVDLRIEFNKTASLDEDEVLILPPPEERGDLEVDAAGTTYTLPLKLAADTAYRVVVRDAEDEEGNQLGVAATGIFTTGTAFAGTRSLSGRLLLPDLPGNRRFVGPIFVGLVPYEKVAGQQFGLSSFDEEDVVASTITFTPEFAIENLPLAGGFALVAYAVVEVPQGFRPPHPRQRSLPAFDLRNERYRNPGEDFDTIELFGTTYGPDGQAVRLRPGQSGVEVMLVGESRTRDELLFITQAQGVVQKGPTQFDTLVELKSGAGPATWPAAADLAKSGIRLAFNKPLRAEAKFAAIEAVLNGQPLRNFILGADRRTIVFPVALQTGQFYQFSVFRAEGEDGSRLERPLDLAFSTGAVPLAFGSIAGTVSLTTQDEDGQTLSGDQADQIDEATVTLMQLSGSHELSVVSVRSVGSDGTFLVDGVLPGAYQIFAEVHTASGQVLNPIHENALQVAGGSQLTGIDLQATVIVAAEEDTATGVTVKTAPPGGNEGAAIGVDLDAASADQGLTFLADLEADQEISLDLYVSGAVDVSGYAVKLGYDPTVLEFVSATDDAGEGNLLRANSGTALFLSPLLGEGTVEFGGAILGAKATTAVDGSGFLGRFTFRILEGFNGTQVAVQSVDLKSLTGQDELQPGLAAKLVPPVFLDQTKGPVSFDFDTDPGDQEVFNKGAITAGSLVEVDVYLNFDKLADTAFKDLSNYSVKVEFDPDQLAFINYAPETAEEENILIAGGGTVPQMPAITTDNSVTFGAAILGPTTSVAPDAGGFIGRLTFASTEQLTTTDLIVTTYSLKKVGGSQQEVSSLIFGRLSTGEIKLTGTLAGGSGDGGGASEAQLAQSDFDGDGVIAFDDFFLFADAFGKSAALAGAAYDLDGDGSISFDDFFVFADLFGKSVGKAAVVAPRLVVAGGLQLAPRSTEEDLVLELQTQALPLRGVGVVVEYDPAAFRLLRVGSEASVLAGEQAPLLLERHELPGQVLVGLSRTNGEGAVEGLLAELHFAPLVPEASGLFRVREATVRDAQGRTGPPQHLGQVEARWVPQTFALQPNYPNPFNPTTAIRFQLPQAARVQLEVYDVLGQKVRTLVQGQTEPGVHRVMWDGRDEGGRVVAGGVYLYRLQAGEFTQVRKLLLLK
ncbi:MAG: Ig-like domain-containing protein [Candidatus Latescibacteria bacterium]|nr:Ig-like domain-containing protein [Candidatus Latescibacterota bacterium]